MTELVGTPLEIPRIPARVNAGLGEPMLVGPDLVTDMRIPEAMLDAAGAVATGALAVLADSAIGFAVVHGVGDGRGMATSHLDLELLRPIPVHAAWLRCTGRLVHLDGAYAFGAGLIEDDTGAEIARSSLGAVLLPARAMGPPATDSGVPSETARAHGRVDDLLGTEVASNDERGAVVRFVASEDVANLTGGVHGGMGVLMGERAMERALDASDADRARFRLVDLHASFPRPIASAGQTVTCSATVVHRGRRLAVVRAELRDERDRLAVVVNGTYLASGLADGPTIRS